MGWAHVASVATVFILGGVVVGGNAPALLDNIGTVNGVINLVSFRSSSTHTCRNVLGPCSPSAALSYEICAVCLSACLSRQQFTLSGVQVVYYVLLSVTIFAYVRVVSANPGRPCDIQNRLRLITSFLNRCVQAAHEHQKKTEKKCWLIGHMPVLCSNAGPHVIVRVCACVCELHVIVCVRARLCLCRCMEVGRAANGKEMRMCQKCKYTDYSITRCMKLLWC
jgi:hypothetical protein